LNLGECQARVKGDIWPHAGLECCDEIIGFRVLDLLQLNSSGVEMSYHRAINHRNVDSKYAQSQYLSDVFNHLPVGHTTALFSPLSLESAEYLVTGTSSMAANLPYLSRIVQNDELGFPRPRL
jgi:hypothetical protein